MRSARPLSTRRWPAASPRATVAAALVEHRSRPRPPSRVRRAPQRRRTRRPTPPRSTPARRCTPTAPSAPRTSSTPTAPATTYVGYAAHCAGTGAATDTNGCDAGSLPLGTRVDFVEGGSLVSEGTSVGDGTLVYSSWLTMQQTRRDRREHLRLQRPRAGQGRRRGRRQGQPVDPVLGRPGRASTPTAPPPATPSTPTATPASAAASRPSPRSRARASAPTARAGPTPSTP